MEIAAIQFRNPAYIQWVKQTTYPMVAIRAIQTGSLVGCWESLIGEQLKKDFNTFNSYAFETMTDLGFDVSTKEGRETHGIWAQAGELILNNDKITI